MNSCFVNSDYLIRSISSIRILTREDSTSYGSGLYRLEESDLDELHGVMKQRGKYS